MVLTGPDVSHYQGVVLWSKVKAAGHSFAFAKATEGSRRVDPAFRQNLTGMKGAGLVPGVYHFLRADSSPYDQASFFVETIGDPTGLLCMLDVEASGTSKPSYSDVLSFADRFSQSTNNHPLIVYTGRWYWVGVMGDPYGAHLGPLHHAKYASTPGELYGGWNAFTFWQHTSTGSCPGINGTCDLNKFYGTMTDLKNLTQAPTTIPTPQGTEEMFIVKKQSTGACLVVLGAATLLITSPANLKAHTDAGLKVATVDDDQFSRYEKLRVDV